MDDRVLVGRSDPYAYPLCVGYRKDLLTMQFVRGKEHGQATVEFGFIAIALLMFTVGLIDVGRGFYQYNAVAVAARFGARWGSVVGGTCLDVKIPNLAMSDWCNALPSAATTASDFWNENGNHPVQAAGTSCPADTGMGNYYWTVNDSTIPDASIVGAVRKRLDSDTSGPYFILGSLSAGFDRSQLRICIEMPSDAYSGGVWAVHSGDTLKVYAYYPFQPTGPLFGSFKTTLTAVSGYTIE